MDAVDWYVELRFNGHRTWLPGWTEARVLSAITAEEAQEKALATCIPCSGVYVSKVCQVRNLRVEDLPQE